ncbi:amidase [Brevibacterium casei]|uniref:Amidase n=1 Tax=Brevibacterium casei TaxID=33889 RepID=A0A269ZGH6_9MICO|nr:amidase [Brevibacterium casei]PAK96907.1 amidase [Brevibacterium casei]QQT70262.1 amidase [Brevibacterium casei]
MTPVPPTITIAELRERLTSGAMSAVDLLEIHLARVAAHPELNAVVVREPSARACAEESDRRLAAGTARPLEGIPFTVKDSFMVAGLTVASGSPAFADLIAQWDAFSVTRLRDAGAVLIGKTTMPPMADGGMQRGLYGRAESPFNPDFLPAAYASGSSNGSGVAVAASLCQFGLGEETVSSGRSPASNNGIVAYTPSRGLISLRGNWPLFPTRDVVVPHTKSVTDLLEVLNVLVTDDPETRGDFWRFQSDVPLPRPSEWRPADFRTIGRPGMLAGARLAAPRRYLGSDPHIEIHPDVRALWEDTRVRLEAAGATVVETDFPLIDEYEGSSPTHERLAEVADLPRDWMVHEFTTLPAFGWDDFLRANGDPTLDRLLEADPAQLFPLPAGALPDRYPEVADNLNRYDDILAVARANPSGIDITAIPGFAAALGELEDLRVRLLEDWLDDEGFDAVVFPANADVGRADADRDPASADLAWRNGTHYSNGNLALRHLGVPTVTTAMGTMATTRMPVGVTFAGAAYTDATLLGLAWDFERVRGPRPLPPVDEHWEVTAGTEPTA